MKIEIAEYSGFCFGVSRAIKTVYDLIEKNQNSKIYTLGKIIHNPIVVEELHDNGVEIISEFDIEKIFLMANEENNSIIIIRTHGISKSIYENLLLYEKANPYFHVVDCTCPYVKKIHNIVEKHSDENSLTLVFGNYHHPEVDGIVSYVNGNFKVFSTEEELMRILNCQKNTYNQIIVVSQTTQSLLSWKKCQKNIQKLYTNAKIFDTICSVTENRQNEALKLAQNVDMMLVIGGKDSSNTNKLYTLSKEYCENTFLIERADEAVALSELPHKYVGITAGASTPDSIIEEVKKIMSTENNIQEDFAQMLEESFKTLNTGDIVRGVITSISPNEIHVDLGAKVTGIIPFDEVTDDSSVKLNEMFKVGDEIEAVAFRVSDIDGVATLSKKRIDAKNNWQLVANAFESGDILEGKVVEVVKGGVIVSIKGVRVFMPASHSSVPRDADLHILMGKTVKVKVIDVQEQPRKRAIVSARAVAKEERKKAEEIFWSNVELNKQYTGVVKSLTNYGAFVDLGGVDGMIHTTELSWTRIKHPSEIVNIGDQVTVYIKDFDKETKRISLGYKTDDTNPWFMFANQYNVDDVVPVKIVSMMPFGAFAEIMSGVDGLIHISQIANKKINKPSDVFEIGQVVDAKIIDIDDEKKKVSLSVRALLEEPLEEEAYQSEENSEN